MTRKDYNLIADALLRARGQCENHDQRMGVAKAIATIAEALQEDNARFDNVRFVNACIGEDTKKQPAYEWEVQGNYDGKDWDCVFTATSAAEAHTTLNEYRENERGIVFRVRKVKVAA